ncbi:PREDICTED: uncharacterized protein LOC109232306 [Nicotiana attenuata]|uniref:uncharacterized protein LOC109232306 n=1 Tax=Nicotiana attenuata TaxID=49451 RepID=UPI0009049E59|nr:PREDICTED: uncharacterized protein LOC109232306 [Nicotiana attenuata]
MRSCNTKFIFVAVYGKHSIQRKSLWTDLERTMRGVQEPSLIMGDFNSILSIEDRVMGNPVQEGEMTDFKNFIADVGLAELKTIGRNYTWTNNHVHSRIDRILANAEWMQKWPNMEGTILQPGFSDHCPLIVTVAEPTGRGRRPFKFFNCLAGHHRFDDIVKEVWMKENKGKSMLKVWHKLKQLKKELKLLNNEEYNSVGPKIQVARNKLMNIQMGMASPETDEEMIALEKETKTELAKWLEVEESIMKQKARIKWLKVGDSNTAYFHACVKNRQARNHIGRLMDNTGKLLQSEKEVEEEILNFYKKLLGTTASTLPIVDQMLCRMGTA